MPIGPSCSGQTQPRRWQPQQRPPKPPWQPARCESLRAVGASRRADRHQRAIPIRLASLNGVNEILLTLYVNPLDRPGQPGIQRHQLQCPVLEIAAKINLENLLQRGAVTRQGGPDALDEWQHLRILLQIQRIVALATLR